jgi:hypothetical protein
MTAADLERAICIAALSLDLRSKTERLAVEGQG